jgi:Carboxypeptidase regulatory-like domain
MRRGLPSTTLFFVAIATGLTAFLTAQERPQVRDAQRTPEPVGTASISGTILTEEQTSRPIRRAVVTLTGSDFTRRRVAVTDDAGRFTFASLPASNFSLNATKAGYVSAIYGARRPGRGPGVPIALADGQRFPVTLKMLRGAVVTGTIRDSAGRPAQAQVQVMQYQMSGGERVLNPFYSGFLISPLGLNTDDRGIYRIFGMPPGEYVVSATVRAAPGELRATSPEEIRWAMQTTQSGGVAAGTVAANTTPPPSGQTVGYAPVYYPGTVDPEAATLITLAAGEERTGVDLNLQLVPTSRLEGTIVGEDGRPAAAASITILPTRIVGSPFQTMPRATINNGRFTVPGLTPGRYVITARGRGAGAGPPAAGGRGGAGPTSWAMQEITVTGQDLTNLELRLEPAMTMSGRLVFESATGQTPPSMTGFRPSLGAWRQGTGPTVSVTVPSATVDAEGRFRFGSVVPGRYRVNAFGGPTNADRLPLWTFKSAAVNGRDITDQPLEIRPGEDLPELVITFTDRATEVTGTLFDGAGRPTSGLTIIAFPVRRELWIQGSRHVRPSPAASDGKYKLIGLPPAEYYFAAVTEYEFQDLWDVSFLDQLAAGAFKVTIAEGEKKVQDVRMGGS